MQDQRDPERNEFRRMLGTSVGLHAALLVVLMVSPAPSAIAPPAAITVDLVAYAPSAAPAPTPEPTSEPAPAPEPAPQPRPQPAEIVLPEKPREAPEPKPQARPKPKPKRREVVLKPKPRVEKSLEDLMAEMREEAGEPAPEPVVQAAAETESQASGMQVAPEVKAWVDRADAHVKKGWTVPFDFRERRLVTVIVVRVDASGAPMSTPQVSRTSGNLAYDDNALNALRKAFPLPPPPEAGLTASFYFDSEAP